jgi:hypothetical protein
MFSEYRILRQVISFCDQTRAKFHRITECETSDALVAAHFRIDAELEGLKETSRRTRSPESLLDYAAAVAMHEMIECELRSRLDREAFVSEDEATLVKNWQQAQ